MYQSVFYNLDYQKLWVFPCIVVAHLAQVKLQHVADIMWWGLRQLHQIFAILERLAQLLHPCLYAVHSINALKNKKVEALGIILHFYWLNSIMTVPQPFLPSSSMLVSRSHRYIFWWWMGCRQGCYWTLGWNPARTAGGGPGVSCGHIGWPTSPSSAYGRPKNTAKRKCQVVSILECILKIMMSKSCTAKPLRTPRPGNKRSYRILCIWMGSAIYAVCASVRLSTTPRFWKVQWAPLSRVRYRLYLHKVI